MTKVASYTNWKRDITAVLKSIESEETSITIVYGTCDFLLWRTRKIFEKSGTNWPLTVINESNLNDEEDFFNLARQEELFQKKPIYLVWALEKPAKVNLCLKLLPRLKSQTDIIIFLKTDNLKLKEPKASHLQLFCPNIFLRDLSEVVLDLAKERDLILTPEAKKYLEECFGDNVFQIEQELEKLALLFAKAPKKPLSLEDLIPHVGFLREDHAFAISELMLANKIAEASLLIVSLLKRGYSPLAILTLIIRFFRKLLLAKTYQDKQQVDIARTLQLPVFIAKNYVLLAKKFSKSDLDYSLMAAHRAEWSLKTNSRINPAIILDALITNFAMKAH